MGRHDSAVARTQGKRLRRSLVISLLLGLALCVVLAFYADAQKLGAGILSFDFVRLPLILLLVFGNYVLRFFKWHGYLLALHIRVPLGQSVLIFLSGLLLSVTPGKLGELLKSALLKQSYDVPVTTSAPIVFAERVTDFLALITLSLFGVLTFGYGLKVVAGTALVLVLMLTYLASQRLSLATIRLFARLPGGSRVAPRLEELYGSTVRLIRPLLLVWTTVLSVIAWSLEAVAFCLILGGFDGIVVEVGTAFFIYAFATIFGAVTMLPGGLFATEGSMVALLQEVFRMVPDAATATAATLLLRLSTLWFGVLVGGVAYTLYSLRRPPPDDQSQP
jgi:glycosyltransferase 2 family protein